MFLPSLESLSIDEQHPVGKQVTDFLRSLIQSGNLQAGQRLPSHQEMANLWSIKPSTVHHALQPLVREGLLSRKPRVGTFVKQVVVSLKRVAIYLDSDVWHEDGGYATRIVVQGLIDELSQRGIEYQVYISSSPMRCHEEDRLIDPQLITDCKVGKVQAILSPQSCTTTIKQLLELKVPFSLCGNGEYPGSIVPSRSQFVDKGIVQLQKQGCQSVGLISVTSRNMCKDNHWLSLHSNFKQRAEELKLRVDPNWVVMPRSQNVEEKMARQFGYIGMSRIWNLSDRPDGLLIYTDIVAQGVVDFVTQANVNVPDDICMVMHANKQRFIEVPFDVTCLSFDLLKVARSMVESIDHQFSGHDASMILQGFDLSHVQPTPSQAEAKMHKIDLDYPLLAGV